MSNQNHKTVTANEYNSDKKVRVSIPAEMFGALCERYSATCYRF